MTGPNETGVLPARAGPGRICGEMPAGRAVSMLMSDVSGIIARTEHAFINDGSTEALHDYRIAVRRTRSLLARLHGVVPEADLSQYRAGFSYIMDKTTLLRDLEVCRGMLVEYMEKKSGRISPLFDHISKREQRERRGLKRYFRSQKYRSFTSAWLAYLKQLAEAESFEHNSTCPVRMLARDAIKARYVQALKHASRLEPGVPAKKFHKLRKSAKKLRYLVDLFSDLYPGKRVKIAKKKLKNLQGCLGAIQDLEVQSCLVREAAGDMNGGLNGKHRKAVDRLLKKMQSQKKDLQQHCTGLVEKFPRKPGESIERLLAFYP